MLEVLEHTGFRTKKKERRDNEGEEHHMKQNGLWREFHEEPACEHFHKIMSCKEE